MAERLLRISPLGAARRERPWRVRLASRLALLLVFLAVASVGYYLIEPAYSWPDSLYMTFITISTTGYGEVHPLSGWGRVWTVMVLVTGLVIGTIVLTSIVAIVVEGRLRSLLGRRELERKIANLTGHVIVCGFGSAGSVVAAQLKAEGRQVVVVDTSPEQTAAAEEQGMLYVLGDAQDESVLQAAGIAKAGHVVASLTTDAENVFVTLSARQLRPDIQVIVRAQHATSEDKLLKAGANRVICPGVMGAMRMSDIIVRPALVDFVDMAHKGVELGMEQLEVRGDSPLVGKTLAELALRRHAGVLVVAVRRAGGEAIYTPGSDFRLQAGDTLVLVGARGAAEAIERLQPPGADQT